jgi:hypothetical protein
VNLSAPWSNIAGLRLERGREGIVTHHPLQGAGAVKLAALRGVGLDYTPMYNEEQRALMAQRRWIPIEAFAWYLKHGPLREDFVHFAPEAEALDPLVAPKPPETPRQRRRSLLIFSIILVVCFGCIIVLGFGPPVWAHRFSAVALAIFALLMTWNAGCSGRNAFRSGAWLLGVLFTLLTLIWLLWCLVGWTDLAQVFTAAK